MKRVARLTGLLCALLMGAAARAQALGLGTAATYNPPAISSGINYQGRLEERDALINGVREMTFTLYDAAAGGSVLWTSGKRTVTVEDGIFGINLGIPTTALLGPATKYMELEIGSIILQPREQLRPVPYARVAERVEGSLDVSVSGLRITTAALSGDAVYVSSAMGRVGIGTTVPRAALSISSPSAGATSLAPELLNPTATDGSAMRVIFNFDAAGAAGSYAAVDALLTNGAAGDAALAFYTRGSAFEERMRIDKDGNVGIGTTNPGTHLEVSTTAAVGIILEHATNPLFLLERGGVAALTLEHDGANGSLGAESGGLYLSTGGQVAVTLLNGGNMGVGTQAPARRLDVLGTFGAGTSVDTSSGGAPGAAAIYWGADTDTGLFWGGPNVFGITTGGTERLRIDAGGNVLIATAPTTASRLMVGGDLVLGNPTTLGATGNPDVRIDGNLSVDGQSFASVVNSTNSVGVATDTIPGQLFKIGAGTFTVLEGGQVGIGTTNPGFPFELRSVDTPAMILDHPTDSQLMLRIGGADRMALKAQAAAAAVGTENATPLVLRTGGVERLRVLSGGNVGVGQAAPAQPLDVNGNLNVNGALSLGVPLAVAFGGTGGTSTYNAQTGLDAPSRGGIGASGTWGIGITGLAATMSQINPAANDACGTGEFPKGISSTGAVQGCVSSATSLNLNEQANEWRIYDATHTTIDAQWTVADRDGAWEIAFDTNSAADATFSMDTGNNRVGIGDRTPSYKLDVAGGINTTGKFNQGGGGLIPAGAIAFTVNTTCPAGWAPYANLAGRYVVGVVQDGTPLGENTAGTALTQGENRAAGIHNHTFTGNPVSHTHTFTGAALAGHSHTFTGTPVGNHTHTFSGNAGSVSHNHTFTTGGALPAHNHTVNDPGHSHDVWSSSNQANDSSPAEKRGGSGGGIMSASATTGITIGNNNDTPTGTVGNSSAGTPAGSNTAAGGHTPSGTVGNDNDTPTGSISAGDIGGHTPAGTVNNSAGTAGTNAPYITLLACQKT